MELNPSPEASKPGVLVRYHSIFNKQVQSSILVGAYTFGSFSAAAVKSSRFTQMYDLKWNRTRV